MDIIIIFTCTFSSQQEQMMVKVHEGVKHLLYFGIADKLLHVSYAQFSLHLQSLNAY